MHYTATFNPEKLVDGALPLLESLASSQSASSTTRLHLFAVVGLVQFTREYGPRCFPRNFQTRLRPRNGVSVACASRASDVAKRERSLTNKRGFLMIREPKRMNAAAARRPAK